MSVETILAPNPGIFTGPGTNTYLIRSGTSLAILDPGPIEASHRTLIEERVGESKVAAVVVTHTHPDHAPLANPLARHFDAPAVGYAPGPEFEPDRVVADGDAIVVGENRLDVLYTPGHADDHICLRLGRRLFTGDHIMGGSTVMIDDLSAYLASLGRLRDIEIETMFPGHGPKIEDPTGVIDYYISHRLEREQEVMEAVRNGSGSVGAIVEEVYRAVDPELHPLAAYSVAAHLRKLAAEGSLALSEDTAADLWDALVVLTGREE